MKTALSVILIALGGVASAAERPDVQVLTLSEQGVGPITAATPFDRTVIQRLLPNFRVKAGVSSTEGEDFPILLVSDKRGLLFTINPADDRKIFSLVIEKDRVANALGHRTGQTHNEVFQGGRGNCYAGMEEYSGTVLCVAPNAKHIHYLFQGRWNGADGQLPPPEVLAGWKIANIVWKP